VDSTKDSTLAFTHRQDDSIPIPRSSLSATDRRLIVSADLRLLARRHTYGQKIFRSDVVRVARFANKGDLEMVWSQLVLAGDGSSPGP